MIYLIPAKLRSEIRWGFFKILQNLVNLLRLPPKFIPIANAYLPVNSTIIDSVIKNWKGCDITYKSFKTSNSVNLSKNIEIPGEYKISPFYLEADDIVLDIRDSRFSFQINHLLDPRNRVVGEMRSPLLSLKRPFYIYSKFLKSPQPLEGVVLFLSDPDPENYYHWICRVLPAMRYYQQVIDLKEVDYFYVGSFPLRQFHHESLSLIGIPEGKLVFEDIIADRYLTVISNRSLDLNDPISLEAFSYLRKVFSLYLIKPVMECDCSPSRLYIERGSASRRRVVNEMQVKTILEKHGFQSVVMDGKSIQEQAKLFAEAEVIVAAHGAALTNLIFVNEGTKVIELMPFDYSNNCFYTLAHYAKAKYFCLKGIAETISTVDDSNRDSNITVDLNLLATVCNHLFA